MFQEPFLQSKTFVWNRAEGKVDAILGSLWWAGTRKLTWVRAVSWYPEGTAPRPRCHVGAPLSLGTSRPPSCLSPTARCPAAGQLLPGTATEHTGNTRSSQRRASRCHRQHGLLWLNISRDGLWCRKSGELVKSRGKLKTQLRKGSIPGMVCSEAIFTAGV